MQNDIFGVIERLNFWMENLDKNSVRISTRKFLDEYPDGNLAGIPRTITN